MFARFSLSVLLSSLFLFTSSFSQEIKRPKLVVGIVVDQMRHDYLYRFYDCFGDDGFKRLMKDGSNFTFAHYNYEYTSTAPGHASIYTGTTPYYHGIISNDFYDRQRKKSVYCLWDEKYKGVGTNRDIGMRSPQPLLATTITDELKLATNKKAKVISVSLKDRGAILPAGHIPDGVYWYDDKTGDFITSTYYSEKLPDWLIKFNDKNLPDKFLQGPWELSLPLEKYSICPFDESKYEKDRFNEGKTSFPHYFNNLTDDNKYGEFENTPFANTLITELSKLALVEENLGKGKQPDFLAISYSAPDHIGHEYGTVSYELMDTYIKLDKEIGEILSLLDEQVGKNNYILFLTADHAGMETPYYLEELRVPSGALNSKACLDSMKTFAKRVYGNEKIVEYFIARQIYLDKKIISELNLDFHIVQQQLADYLRSTFPSITSIYKRDFLETQVASRSQINFTVNGFHPYRSGDLFINLLPGYLLNHQDKGTQHGSAYNYDTHVPLLFYGWGIPAKTVNDPVYVIDIAATIADLLKIPEPNASIGIPLIK